MIFTPFAFMAPSGGDADADAYISAVTTAGGTLSAGEETAIQTLFTSLKSNSLYSKLQLFYPMMGSTAASTALNGNLNTNFDITWNGSLGFSANGVQGTGTNGDYGNTNFNPSTDGGGNSFTWGIYNTAGNFSGENYMFGGYDGTYLDTNRGDSSTNTRLYGYTVGSGGTLVSAPSNDGQWTATFDATSGNKKLYFNADQAGYASGTFSAGGLGRANIDVYLFALNISNSPYRGWSGSNRFFYYGEYLTTNEVETINTIIQTFQTSLGRNTY